ncbi:siderophore-interacting protein [Pyxidicoccus fallax]|uniref:Siderophore-interacting protein n=1 Tax=Pyxidicoccus fallax TaxID=394095 RepID=A0A848LWN8_9BACT|nr:siderophore-interacting protein [Pyxidicoccus fallax]NMO21972.1 siderophore-interacting protein [Pyxidicoccus fallax]NPC83443.1 siderophore-interacting protein [Pyxidicoccus fallax]
MPAHQAANRALASDAPRADTGEQGTRHQGVRVRHELRRRKLVVSGVEALTPRMRRIHFTSPELADFHSPAPDDHIKLFFPEHDARTGEPAMRDFTPRAYDNAGRTLTIDFALHASGPATEWAAGAQAGQTLEIGGPRGSHLVPDDFDWYLLVGDESALPAMGRRVEMLRPGVPVTTVVAVVNEDEKQTFVTRASWRPEWVVRGEPSPRDGELLLRALAGFSPPAGDGFVWIAGEAELVREVRAWFIEERKHPGDWLKAASYWHRGTHEGGGTPA